MLSILESFKLLRKYKINTVPYAVVDNVDTALKKAKHISYPIVLKAISHKITHKTNYGIVRLDIMDDEDLKDAWRIIRKRLSQHNTKFEGMMLQKQLKGYELIIGGKKDDQFGQMIVFGLGGIYVEVFKDISARICPIEKDDAIEMIREIKAHPIIAGMRGKKPVNEDALVDALMKTSKLLINEQPKELDLNPLFADEKGYYVVDARVIK
ncbi:acetate--CoA ligase family protein [Candidatus Micrarchaeota archaeon]|nr:acetate--CoA ligase family protein [Candidatus Micrarchaeota archaeon]